jgi:hypothetical protein
MPLTHHARGIPMFFEELGDGEFLGLEGLRGARDNNAIET